MSVVRYVLSDPAILAASSATTGVDESAVRPSRVWVAATALLAVATAAFAVLHFTRDTAAPAQSIRFTVSYPSGVLPLSNGSDNHGGSLSPDGRYLAFSGADSKTGHVAIFVRRLDTLDAATVPGTEDGRYPFWSPDSRTLAFFSQGKLKRVNLDGSAPQVICDSPAGGWGGSWNADDIIIAGITDPGPIARVCAKGDCPPVPVATMAQGDFDHDWPYFLPDGRHFIYTAWSDVVGGSATIYVGSIDSTESKVLAKDVVQQAGFAGPDYLLLLRNDALTAQKLDLRTFEFEGSPLPVASNALQPLSASTTGTLAYTTGAGIFKNRLAWIDADGTNERVVAGTGYYSDPSISPDGSKLAYGKKDSLNGGFDIWIRDVASGEEQRLTFDRANEVAPVWSPASDELIFRSDREPPGLYRKKANGVGEQKLIPGTDKVAISPYQWHRDGYVLAYGGSTTTDILKLSIADSVLTPFVASPSVTYRRGAVSPDGRWLAYDARETARFEVYLTTNPPLAGTRWMVTTAGGAEPKWSKDGKQLFYVSSATGALMVVNVTPGDPPRFSAPRQVHPGPIDWGWNSSHSFDLDPRSGRLLIEIVEGSFDLTVLTNWHGLLNK